MMPELCPQCQTKLFHDTQSLIWYCPKCEVQRGVSDNHEEMQYYIQKADEYLGNNMVWWAKDHNGYTDDIDKAHVFTLEEAKAISEDRKTDKMWEKPFIDSLPCRRTVNTQDLNREILKDRREAVEAFQESVEQAKANAGESTQTFGPTPEICETVCHDDMVGPSEVEYEIRVIDKPLPYWGIDLCQGTKGVSEGLFKGLRPAKCIHISDLDGTIVNGYTFAGFRHEDYMDKTRSVPVPKIWVYYDIELGQGAWSLQQTDEFQTPKFCTHAVFRRIETHERNAKALDILKPLEAE